MKEVQEPISEEEEVPLPSTEEESGQELAQRRPTVKEVPEGSKAPGL